MKKAATPYAWEMDFPPVFGHTSVSFLKHCPGFHLAKTGDAQAAAMIVRLCTKQPRLMEIRRQFPSAMLLPVITNNKLPEALARRIGLPVCTEVRALPTVVRKNLSAMERFVHKPQFCGPIKRGARYILVDDIVKQGGTLSALRQHVISLGGQVCAVSALACATGRCILAPNRGGLPLLAEMPGIGYIIEMLREYGLINELSELTEAQVRYILRFKRPDSFLKKLEHTCGKGLR